ncbi:MAG TPA: RHS repeat-associated core domain-containing protein [Candidatus Angelobacter sp.]
MASAAGAIEEESDYYPFGTELVVAAGSNHYKFTSKERDSETSLDYFGARYFWNGMGRFVTSDWSAGPATVPYAHLDNPQTLNLYSYVDNNPINGIDPDGHATNHEFDGPSGLDAAPPNEGGPTQSQAVLTLAAMQNLVFGYQIEDAQKAQQQNGSTSSSSSGASTHYASVSYWPTGAGGFGHIGIQVDSDDTQGYSTADPKVHWWTRLFRAPAGHPEDDLQAHTKNGEVARHSYLHIPISADQAQAMSTEIAKRAANPGHYNLIFNNCTGFVESVLHAGKVSGVPHREIFGPAILRAILWVEH